MRCVFCGVILSNWQVWSNIAQEHFRFSPTCIMARERVLGACSKGIDTEQEMRKRAFSEACMDVDDPEPPVKFNA